MPARNDLGCLIEKISFEHRRAVGLYYALSIKPELTDSEADCLDQILGEAELDDGLDFLLNEIDYMIGQTLGLRDENHIKSYRDQKAYLREHLVILKPKELDYHRELQKLLKERGYYKGPVDGVTGKDFRKAVRAFQKSTHLEPDGIIGLKTLLKLMPNPDALRNFIPNETDFYRTLLERCLEVCNPPPGGDHA